MTGYLWTIALLGALAALGGCGDDDDEDGATNTPINQLSPAQAKSACNSIKSRFDRLTAASVKIGCTESAREEADCDEARALCLRTDQPDVGDEIDCTDTSEVEESDCSATLGEVQACLEAYVRSVESLATRYTCDSTEPEVPTQPAACARIEATCPDFGSIGTE